MGFCTCVFGFGARGALTPVFPPAPDSLLNGGSDNGGTDGRSEGWSDGQSDSRSFSRVLSFGFCRAWPDSNVGLHVGSGERPLPFFGDDFNSCGASVGFIFSPLPSLSLSTVDGLAERWSFASEISLGDWLGSVVFDTRCPVGSNVILFLAFGDNEGPWLKFSDSVLAAGILVGFVTGLHVGSSEGTSPFFGDDFDSCGASVGSILSPSPPLATEDGMVER